MIHDSTFGSVCILLRNVIPNKVIPVFTSIVQIPVALFQTISAFHLLPEKHSKLDVGMAKIPIDSKKYGVKKCQTESVTNTQNAFL